MSPLVMKDSVTLEAKQQIRNLRIDFFKACTVGRNRRIRIRFWDARIEVAQNTSAVLITSPKRDRAFILTKKYTELSLEEKKKKLERREERVSERNKRKQGRRRNFKGKEDRWAPGKIFEMSSMLDRALKRKYHRWITLYDYLSFGKNYLYVYYLSKRYRCEVYRRSIFRVGCAEKHSKTKVWCVKIDMDYKGMWEQIITHNGTL